MGIGASEPLPYIVIHGIKRAPLDFVYRLVGTEVRRHIAEDRIGQWTSKVPGQPPPSQIWDTLARIAATGRPLLDEASCTGPHRYIMRTWRCSFRSPPTVGMST